MTTITIPEIKEDQLFFISYKRRGAKSPQSNFYHIKGIILTDGQEEFPVLLNQINHIKPIKDKKPN